MAARKGDQSWYRATRGIITKKWKCISMRPPEKWTRIAEAKRSPAVAAAARGRRRFDPQAAKAAPAAMGNPSRKACHTEYPWMIP